MGVLATAWGQEKTDSLYQSSVELLEQAQGASGDFSTQITLAQQAAAGFEVLQADSLELQARFLAAMAARYLQDSVNFTHHIEPILKIAQKRKDTAALVKAYNMQGLFYFSQGNSAKGIAMLKIPEQRSYYSASAAAENSFNLGALIDICLTYTMDLDSVYHYLNKLQRLAQLYPEPSVQVVSRFKLAQLFTKAYNYKESLEALRAAYPYLKELEDKGIANYYYSILIKNFIDLSMPDSAMHYIGILEKVASYSADDPRNCYTVVAKTRAHASLGRLPALSHSFEVCYEQLTATLDSTQKVSVIALGAMNAKCSFYLLKKDWPRLNQYLQELITYATKANSNQYLVNAYQMKFEALMEQGLDKPALEAHIQFKAYSDKVNQYTFTQSEALIKNQLGWQLASEENQLLEVENLKQKLRIIKDRNIRLLSLLGILLLGGLTTYFVRLSKIRKQQSEALSQIIAERTAQIEKTNKELTKTNQELLRSNTELERFAYVASHDLKTPLHNMIKFSGLLQRRLRDNADPEAREYLGFILRGGKRLNNLIEDMLEYAQFSMGYREQKSSIVDLGDLIKEVQTSLFDSLEQPNYLVMILPTLPRINWNYSKLFILFKNLIENSIKYNESEQPRVIISSTTGEDICSIFIEDNGIGIGETFHEKIFQMFTRLHNHSSYEGSGLGLAICQKVVEEMGGKISVQSQEQKYSVFRIDLPLQLIETKKGK